MTSNPKKFNEETEQLFSSIWGERHSGLEMIAVDWDKPIRHEDVLYLLNRYGYLQLVNTEPSWEGDIVPQFFRARSLWIIHDYGQAISSSPGRYLYGRGNPEVRAEEEGTGGGNEGYVVETGSSIRQAFETAEAMIHLVMDKGWPGAEIISGSELMKCAAWIIAQNAGYNLQGYSPSEKDKQKRDRILRAREALKRISQPGVQPGV